VSNRKTRRVTIYKSQFYSVRIQQLSCELIETSSKPRVVKVELLQEIEASGKPSNHQFDHLSHGERSRWTKKNNWLRTPTFRLKSKSQNYQSQNKLTKKCLITEKVFSWLEKFLFKSLNRLTFKAETELSAITLHCRVALDRPTGFSLINCGISINLELPTFQTAVSFMAMIDLK